MATISEFAQFLLERDPKRNLPRLTLYNYLKNCHDLQKELKYENFQGFFDTLFHFHYWLENKSVLGQAIQEEIDLFSKKAALRFESQSIRKLYDRQIIAIEMEKDWDEIINQYFEKRLRPGEAIRQLPLSNKRRMAFRQFSDSSFDVYVFDQSAYINHGKLIPLDPVTKLHYNQLAELKENEDQVIEISPILSSHFRYLDGQFFGLNLRGHLLQKAQTFTGPVINHNELFYAIKSIEKHFINPHSDPFYQELVVLLEKANQLVKEGRPESFSLAQQSLKKARLAIKNIFCDDKLLLLLVNNLEFLINSRHAGRQINRSQDQCERISPISPLN